jgi:hypothetical protein
MEKAEVNFDILFKIARGDIHTTCPVPVALNRSNIHPVFLDPDDVILQVKRRVRAMPVFAHPSILVEPR